MTIKVRETGYTTIFFESCAQILFASSPGKLKFIDNKYLYTQKALAKLDIYIHHSILQYRNYNFRVLIYEHVLKNCVNKLFNYFFIHSSRF